MQRIINALVQHRNLILYIVPTFISLLFLNGRSRFHQKHMQRYGMYFSQGLNDFSNTIGNYFRLKKINEMLLAENKKLKEKELKSNNIPLYPSILKTKKRFPYKVKEANVIRNSYLNQINYILIDKGYEDGIKKEMAVLSNQGIVGIVKSVSDHYSSIVSILNQDLKINVRLKKSNTLGSLSWKGTGTTDFVIEDVVQNAQLAVGDTIVTGGMSSYFPFGIPLGKITSFEKNTTSGYYSINAKLFDDPTTLYYVYVVEHLDQEEINTLYKETIK